MENILGATSAPIPFKIRNEIEVLTTEKTTFLLRETKGERV